MAYGIAVRIEGRDGWKGSKGEKRWLRKWLRRPYGEWAALKHLMAKTVHVDTYFRYLNLGMGKSWKRKANTDAKGHTRGLRCQVPLAELGEPRSPCSGRAGRQYKMGTTKPGSRQRAAQGKTLWSLGQMCHTEVSLTWHLEPGSSPEVEQPGRWLLAFHPLSTAPMLRNSSASRRSNFFPFQEGFLPRPGRSAYQEPAGSQDGVEAVYPLPVMPSKWPAKSLYWNDPKFLLG